MWSFAGSDRLRYLLGNEREASGGSQCVGAGLGFGMNRMKAQAAERHDLPSFANQGRREIAGLTAPVDEMVISAVAQTKHHPSNVFRV
ncbi:hypothetical protein CKO25_00495 [Thiocapsa imhoffii]|uniref:Uncharacterized protein n=1 Tax=Thiocapsa imhoffii TaxID=382777 RepID=A0A9X0WEA9_9GAMM|nr:hypothetical protein [Thiocapsa imhoffii]